MDVVKPEVMVMFAGPNGSGKSTIVQNFLRENPVVFINPDDIGRKITYTAQENSDLKSNLVELGKAFYETKMSKGAQSTLAKSFYLKDHGILIVTPVTKEEIEKNAEGTTLYKRLQTELDTSQNALITDDHYLLIGINLVAAQVADELKELYIEDKTSFAIAEQGGFAFETVMSSSKSIDHLKMAKKEGLETTTFYITTSDPKINVQRVSERAKSGGHSIEPDTITKRHGNSLQLLPEAVLISDTAHIVDTTDFDNIRSLELGKDLTPSEKIQKLQTFLEEGKFPESAIEATKKMKTSELVPNMQESIDRIPSPIKEKIQEQLEQKDIDKGRDDK